MVPTGEVPPSHTALEKNVSSDQDALGWDQRAQTSGAVARHMKNLNRLTQPFVMALINQLIRAHGLDFELEPPAFKKFRVFNHGDGEGMHIDRAAMTSLDRRRIRHMVIVPVCEDKEGNLLPGKRRVCSLRRIKEDVALGGSKKKGIGIQHAAGERLKRCHGFLVGSK